MGSFKTYYKGSSKGGSDYGVTRTVFSTGFYKGVLSGF